MAENESIEPEELVGVDEFLSSEIEKEINNSPPPKPKTKETISPENKSNPTQFFLIPFIILFLLILGMIGVFASKILFKPQPKLEISLTESLIEEYLPPPPEENILGKLDKNSALEIIKQWLKAKSVATGPDYNMSELKKILTNPLLSKWEGNSRDLRNSNAYRRYEHQLSIESAEANPQNTTEGVITARVQEKSQYYRNGALIPSLSYQDNLLIRYYLIKENNQWFIKDVKILKKI